MKSKLQREIARQAISSAYQVIEDEDVSKHLIIGRIYTCSLDGTYGAICKRQLEELNTYKILPTPKAFKELWLWCNALFITNVFIVYNVGARKIIIRRLIKRNEILEEEVYVR